MKTLVCILGNLRGGNEPVESLHRHVLKPLDADLALCIGQCPDHPYKRLAKYIWEIDEPENWGEIWDRAGTAWRRLDRDLNKGFWGGIEGPGSGAIVLAFRYLLKEKLQELDLSSEYGRFVITRSDHLYTKDQLSFPPGVHVPTGEDYGGITDRHMIVDSENVIAVLSVLEYLNEVLPRVGRKNPEKILRDCLEHRGIKINRYPRDMFTVARIGEQTRWRTPQEKYKGDLYFKYPSEYDEVLRHLHGRERVRLSIARSISRSTDLLFMRSTLKRKIRGLKLRLRRRLSR